MNDQPEPAEAAKEIIDRNLYMVVATADRSGQPWASPVYYAHSAYREFFWVSRPEADHSRNLLERREVGIVIFDSSQPVNTGEGVYISGVAQELPAHESEEGIEILSKRSASHGYGEWGLEDVREPAHHRLYRATAEAVYVLDEHDQRVEVNL